jgi:hypothetical protein
LADPCPFCGDGVRTARLLTSRVTPAACRQARAGGSRRGGQAGDRPHWWTGCQIERLGNCRCYLGLAGGSRLGRRSSASNSRRTTTSLPIRSSSAWLAASQSGSVTALTSSGTVASGPKVPPGDSKVEPIPVRTAVRSAQSDQSWASPMAFRCSGGGRRCQWSADATVAYRVSRCREAPSRSYYVACASGGSNVSPHGRSR